MLLSFVSFAVIVPAQKKAALVTPNPSKEAKALFGYLNDMYGKKILSGQMWSSWGIDELKYIQEVTGKQPAIRGMDFINNRENEDEVKRAIDWWKGGGIPTIMWHWGAPSVGEGYENSKKPVSIDSIFIEGTPQYKSFWYELERKADLLQKTRDANVPILWRPFHELNGNWFWWGKQGLKNLNGYGRRCSTILSTKENSITLYGCFATRVILRRSGIPAKSMLTLPVLILIMLAIVRKRGCIRK